MKKFLFILCVLTGITSCHIVTPEEPVQETEKAYEAYGLLTIPSSGFTKENVRVKIIMKDNSLLDLYMFEVKFATAMPVTIDMLVSDVTYTEETNVIHFSGDGIIPTAGGKPYEKYTIHDLEGRITNDSIILSNYYGETLSTYEGKISAKTNNN